MEKLKLNIVGEFDNQEKLETYLKAVLNAIQSANKHNIPFKSFDGLDGEGNSIDAIVKCEEEKCPVCESTHIRKDFDFPNTMRCCKDCGADFMIDGEIILNPRELK